MILTIVLAAVHLAAQTATHDRLAAIASDALRAALTRGADDLEIRSIRHRFPCIEMTAVRVESVDVDTERAVVSLDVTAQEQLFPAHWLVRLRRRHGGWRAVRFDIEESLLADRIAAAGDRNARRSLLAAHAALITPELSRRLSERGDEIEERSDGRHAEELAQLAREIAADWHDPAGEARALWVAGRATNSLDEIDVAASDYADGYALAVRANDTDLMAANLVGMGTEFLRSGKVDRTAELERGLQLALSVHDDRIAWMAVHRLAYVDKVAGRYGAALRKYDQALILAQQAGDPVGQAMVTSDIGITYDYMNSHAAAYEYIRRGVALYRRTGNTGGLIRNIRNMADMEAWDGRYADAEKHLREVEILLRRRPNDRTSAFVAATRSTLAIKRHDMAAAGNACNEALALALKTGMEDLVTNMTEQLAGVRVREKRYAEAASLARQAIERSRNVTPEFDIYWHAQLDLGRALAGQADLIDARAAFEDAIRSIEAAEAPRGSDDQQSFFADKRAPYYEMFRTLTEHPDEAIPWVERARARTLLEFLTAGKPQASSRSLSTAERAQEAAIERGVGDLNIRINEERARPDRNEVRIEAIERELAAKRLERALFIRRLYEAHPDLAVARGDVPAASVAEMRRTIPADGAILEYVCLPDRSWLIVLTRDDRPRIYSIRIELDTLQRLISELRAELEAHASGFRAHARRLYDLLVAPADALVRTKRILCFVPDAPMGNLPFQALIDGNGKYVIERSGVFYAPSAAYLTWRAAHGVTRGDDAASLLAFGNPLISAETARTAHARTRGETLTPLPEAEEEIRALKRIYGARAVVRVGAGATEAQFKKDAPRFRVLHLATHGRYVDSDPMYSYLVLARRPGDGEDGLLEAREVGDLDLHADLVVLSACETGRGDERAGEGMIGLSWALLAAGCDTAILTNFNIDSASSRDLMIAFHRRLLRHDDHRLSGRAAVEALRDAEIAVLKSGRSHPFYWASFFAAGRGW